MARVAAGGRCRCCPYGQHIDTGFVAYAEDVARGASNKRTPTMPRRNLMSPLDSIFSDSMENLMSDFEEILAVDKEPQKPKEAVMTFQQKRLQNGYTSDYTGYRSNNVHVPSTTPTRTFALDYSSRGIAPPKPVNRTPTTNGRSTPSAYTALGRTIAEIKTRNVESPLPDRDRGAFSRTGTPIDLGLPQTNGHQTNGHATKTYEYREHRETSKELERPVHLTLPRTTPPDSKPSDFASLRRGREVAVPEQLSRARYFSASPKLPRRLQPAPPLQNPSNFTYSQQNGHTVLSKSQGTCTSPVPAVKEEKKIERSTVGTSTGPLPPQKPCGECHSLRKELKETLKKIPPPKPVSFSIALGTEADLLEGTEIKEIAVGEQLETTTNVNGTEKAVTEDRACSPIKWDILEFGCQTIPQETAVAETQVEKKISHGSTQYEAPVSCHFGTNTDPVEEQRIEKTDTETMTVPKYFRNIPSQTEQQEEPELTQSPPPLPSSGPPSPNDGPSCSDTASQTDGDSENCEPRVLEDSEIAESLWLMPGRETAEIAVGPDENDPPSETISEYCQECLSRTQEEVFTRNVGVGACAITDKVCVSCDNCTDEVDENDVPGFQQPKKLDGHQVAAVKKLLTSEQKQPFVRGSNVTKSARIERKKSDEMAWVELTRRAPSAPTPVVPPSQPTEDTSDALTAKVILKKEIPQPPSTVPDPVPARIPRPKISKYAPPEENAETPDEEDEAADRLTPLRSEMRTLGRWRGGPREVGSRFEEEDEEELSDEEGSYETHEESPQPEGTPFEVTGPLREALVSLNSHLLQPGSISADTADWALKYVQHEWHKTAARKNSQASHVECMVAEMKQLSPIILKTVVNMVDQNDNTSLHYAVSHGNFDVVQALLDSGECQLNLANKAGYTAVMLAALCSLEDAVERTVVQRLFEMGNVNARATQHGQTALMLAVSHGKKTAAELLLACEADVNMQDEEGSTALMCAAEHGHRELVKLLLSCDGIDAAVTDCDSSTALSIAVENGHRDIGVLIYAHLNIMKERWSEPTEVTL